MKTRAVILAAATIVFGLALQLSSARVDQDAWDDIEMGVTKLQNEGIISEVEGTMFQEVIILGAKGETEEAIKTLTQFLKGNRKTALREVSREAMAQLIKQRKTAAHYTAKPAGQQRECNIELKVCPNGAVVGREGSACAFVACPTN